MSIAKKFDDWSELITFLPSSWLELAHQTGALRGLRKNKSPEDLLRTMLIHCACGYSLRETAVRAREANLADMSDVALFKRFKKCQEWFRQMCICLFEERGAQMQKIPGLRLRLFDATHVKEPGLTGSQWRIHYSINLPDLNCDYFDLTPSEGLGNGESFTHFPVKGNDLILADRGYCRGPGIVHIVNSGGYVTVRLHHASVSLYHADGRHFNFMEELVKIEKPGDMGEWSVFIKADESGQKIEGRLCVVRKSKEEAMKSQRRSIKKAKDRGKSASSETLFVSEYISVFTTFPEIYGVEEILSFYRLRWQIELIFKKFKQIVELGHLPKYDEQSSKAWLYGKLLVALLIEKLIAHAGAISPWRSENVEDEAAQEFRKGIRLYVSSGNGDRDSSPELDDGAFRLA
jgi:hypothetical protein